MGDRLSENSDDHFSIAITVQISGILMKKPFGHRHNSNKLSKRFFIVKDGFLLYYPESERKIFEKKGGFSIHPKGVIPLGGCVVEPVVGTGPPYFILICSDELTCGHVTLAADTQLQQERWVAALQEASRITWKNTQLGEQLIRELESQGLQLSKEKQEYFDRLQVETIALQDEIDKNEELEKLSTELEKEKEKLQEMMQHLADEHLKTKRECDEAVDALRLLEDDKLHLKQTTDLLQKTIEDLAQERERTVELLRARDQETHNLHLTTEELQNTLREIEEETKLLVSEKDELEQRYLENQVRAQVLEEERQIFSEQANQLLSSLNELAAEKELTEAELKEEILARINAEKRLKAADESLYRLEMALRCKGNSISDPLRNELLPDVKNLKKFFEAIAEESRIDANKPIIMKNAVLARKSYIQRVRTFKLQAARQEKARSLAVLFHDDVKRDCALRRTQSVLVSTKAENKLQTLQRTKSARMSRISKTAGTDQSPTSVSE